jgi:hypothetical protein
MDSSDEAISEQINKVCDTLKQLLRDETQALENYREAIRQLNPLMTTIGLKMEHESMLLLNIISGKRSTYLRKPDIHSEVKVKTLSEICETKVETIKQLNYLFDIFQNLLKKLEKKK